MSGAVTLPPYPEYQSVDDTWFDRIPVHWKATALRGVLNQRNEKNNPIKTTQILSLSIAHGVTLYSDRGRGGNKRKGDLSAYKIAHEGDIVLNSMNVIVGAVGLSRYTGAISPVYYALYPNTIEASITYYDKVFSNPVFQRYLMIYGRGILIKKSDSGKFNTIRMKISPNDLKGTLLPLPPRTEQEQIVAYMRAQDAHIARFIQAKRDLIKLLTEQKLRIIDHAVTRGLDAAVTLKPSGIEWLGEVPEHWEVVLIKHVADVRFSGVDKHSHDHETPVHLCNYTDVYKNDRITDNMDLMRATATTAEIGRLTLKAGDVILTKDSETPDDIGVPAWVPNDLPGVVCAYHLGLLRPVPDRVLGEFLFRAIGSARTAQQFHVLATGVTRFALGKHDVKNAVITLPPVEEQTTICRWITEECQPLDDAITRAEEEIKLIREYRDRLIADVVTGQIDVRGWQPGPEDVVDDAALSALGDENEEVTEEEDGDGED